jgi:hypothetical protein
MLLAGTALAALGFIAGRLTMPGRSLALSR